MIMKPPWQVKPMAAALLSGSIGGTLLFHCLAPMSHMSCLNMPFPHLVLGVSALHYSTGSQNSEGVWTVASACVLHQPTIMHLSISIVSVWKFRVMLG